MLKGILMKPLCISELYFYEVLISFPGAAVICGLFSEILHMYSDVLLFVFSQRRVTARTAAAHLVHNIWIATDDQMCQMSVLALKCMQYPTFKRCQVAKAHTSIASF